jgi:hypothetical protein
MLAEAKLSVDHPPGAYFIVSHMTIWFIYPHPIQSVKKTPIYSRVIFNKLKIKKSTILGKFVTNFIFPNIIIPCRNPLDDKTTSNGSIAPCSLVMRRSDILLLKTPDDGHKRAKHAAILCFNKLNGYIENLVLSVIY